MEKIVTKLVALGVPGLLLLVAMSITGLAGAAAITAALAALGGPFGMLGGVAMLGITALVADGLATYGVDKLTAWSKAMAGGKTVDEASREQLGIPWQALDQNWRQSVAKLLEEDN